MSIPGSGPSHSRGLLKFDSIRAVLSVLQRSGTAGCADSRPSSTGLASPSSTLRRWQRSISCTTSWQRGCRGFAGSATYSRRGYVGITSIHSILITELEFVLLPFQPKSITLYRVMPLVRSKTLRCPKATRQYQSSITGGHRKHSERRSRVLCGNEVNGYP